MSLEVDLQVALGRDLLAADGTHEVAVEAGVVLRKPLRFRGRRRGRRYRGW